VKYIFTVFVTGGKKHFRYTFHKISIISRWVCIFNFTLSHKTFRWKQRKFANVLCYDYISGVINPIINTYIRVTYFPWHITENVYNEIQSKTVGL
jgi:hypothetical protein